MQSRANYDEVLCLKLNILVFLRILIKSGIFCRDRKSRFYPTLGLWNSEI